MSENTVAELLTWMDGKSKTYGWDAIVAYDRRKTNALLHHQYVDRFNGESYIPLISTALPSSPFTTELLYGLKLSVPKLSFANADLASSKADLTMDMVGGLIVTELNAPGIPKRVDSIKQVLPLGGPQLTMTLPLENTPGTANERQVTLDISNGENFRANFVIGDLEQIEVGSRFKVMFQKLEDKQKVFSLGSLTGEMIEYLTPELFEIRTLQAPLGTQDGDGAVLVFIKFVGGSAGGMPPAPDPDNPDGFRYLIPKDGAGAMYSATMLLSSRTVFDRVMRAHAIEDIGNDIQFSPFDGSTDLAYPLKAIGGGVAYSGFRYDYKVRSDDFDATFFADFNLSFEKDTADEPFTIKARGRRISLIWQKTSTCPFSRVIHWDWPVGSKWDYGDLYFNCNYQVNFDTVLDEASGVVSFNRSTDSIFEMSMRGHETLPDFPGSVRAIITERAKDYFAPKINAMLRTLTAPAIDTFLARNLLFPGNDVFQLTSASVPGDLALFGHLDPVRTSITITPSQSLIEAGKSQPFQVVGDGVSNLLWSVRDTDGETANVGTISAQGVYTAPPASELRSGYITVLVTADGIQNGEPVKASALVSIIDSTIAANPIFRVVAPAQEVTLSAETIDGSAPVWTLLQPELGATLTPHEDNPGHRLYKAGPKISTPFTLDTVQVKSSDGSPKVVKLLIPNFTTGLTLKVADSSELAPGEVQLQVLIDNEVVDPAIDPYTLTLLDGGGELNPTTGVYKEPVSEQTSFAIITVSIGSGNFGHYGFLALPLPLSTYSNVPDAFDEKDPSAVWHDVL